jgi:DsbC/DsbD-like thiol-disulfide interchange protein
MRARPYRGPLRFAAAVVACGVMLLPWTTRGQVGDPLPSIAPDRVELDVLAEPQSAKQAAWMIRLTVSPLPGIHVYAPGNDGYIGVALKLQLPGGLRASAPTYPPGDPYVFGALKELVEVYERPFTIEQRVTLAPRAPAPRSVIAVRGTVRYQACTDRVCFPPQQQDFHVELRGAAGRPHAPKQSGS